MRRNFFTIFKDLENLMNDDFLTDFNVTLKNDLDKNIKRYTSNRPLTNVYEDEWSFRYEIFTPGFLTKEISIEVKDGSIEVTGVFFEGVHFFSGETCVPCNIFCKKSKSEFTRRAP